MRKISIDVNNSEKHWRFTGWAATPFDIPTLISTSIPASSTSRNMTSACIFRASSILRSATSTIIVVLRPLSTTSRDPAGHIAVILESLEKSLMKLPRRFLFLLLLFGCNFASVLRADESVGDTQSVEPRPAPTLTVLQAVILGFVEGATEYLPVSSTGHLLIVQHLLGMDSDERQIEAAHSLAICIQSGAILAVLVLYFGRIRQILRGMAGRDTEGLRLLINLVIAFLPAAVIGLLFNKWIKQHLFGVLPVAAALFLGGVVILVQTLGRKKPETDSGKEISQMSWREALFVGVLQCLAFWPGFSRSLATILGCRFVGLRMMAAVEYSFLLGLVTLTAATGYEGMKNGSSMIADYGVFTPMVALVTAFVAAVVSVRFMVGALGRFGLMPFGFYRIALALVCVAWFIA